MPHTTERLRQLLDELHRAQRETGHLAERARQELAGVMIANDLKPASPAARSRQRKTATRSRKAGKKKR